MASTQATAQSYNDTNVIGQVLQIGAARNTGQFMAAIGGLNGARRIKSQSFDMCASYALDTPAQNAIDETASLSVGSERFYAKTPVANVVQITKKAIIVSDLREAAVDQIVASDFISPNIPKVSEFDNQAAMAMQQFNADWEFSALQGTYVARASVTTDVAMGGLVDATVGIATNKINASSAALEADMISQLLVKMSENGAPFDNLAIVARPKYIDQLGLLYGFAPQDRNVGGIMLKQIWTTFGPVSLIYTMAAHATTLCIVDMAHVRPVVLPHKGGIDILMKEFIDGGSAQKGYVEGFIGIDFEHESLHGSVYGLAA